MPKDDAPERKSATSKKDATKSFPRLLPLWTMTTHLFPFLLATGIVLDGATEEHLDDDNTQHAGRMVVAGTAAVVVGDALRARMCTCVSFDHS